MVTMTTRETNTVHKRFIVLDHNGFHIFKSFNNKISNHIAIKYNEYIPLLIIFKKYLSQIMAVFTKAGP